MQGTGVWSFVEFERDQKDKSESKKMVETKNEDKKAQTVGRMKVKYCFIYIAYTDSIHIVQNNGMYCNAV